MPLPTTVILVSMLSLFLAARLSSQERQDQRPLLWRKLEQALVNGSWSDEMLYNLSDVFFSPTSLDDAQNSPSVSVLVGVTVDTLDDPYMYLDEPPGLCCSTNMGYCSQWVNCRDIERVLEQPKRESGASQISNLIAGPEISMVLTAFDPAFYYLMKKLSDEALDFISVLDFQQMVEINFHISQLAVMPSERELNESLAAILTWAKSYTRAHGVPYEKHDRDRYLVVSPADVVEDTNETMLISHDSTATLLLCAFLLANLLVLMAAMMFFDDIFLFLQSSSKLRAVYMASGVVLSGFNIVTFVCGALLLHQFMSKPNIYVYYIAIKLPLMVLVFTLEIIVVSYNTYKHRHMTCHQWIGHIFASCHIFWFVHRLVTDAIISVTSFIIAPAQTLGVFTLILLTVACLVLFVAYIIYKGFSGCNRKTCLPLFGAIIIGITTCGLVSIFTLLFIALVDNGLKSAGIGGFILSLVPPSIIFIAGLLVEWKVSMGYLPRHYTSKDNPDSSAHLSSSDRKSNKSHGERTGSRHKAHLLSAVSIQAGDHEKESNFYQSPNTAVNEYTPLLN